MYCINALLIQQIFCRFLAMDENVLRLTSRGLVKEQTGLDDNKSSNESSLDQSIATLHQAVNKVRIYVNIA